MRRLQLLLAFLSLLAVAALVFRAAQQPSPGDVAEVHDRERELRGGSACGKCHGSGAEALDRACMNCHTDVREQVDRGDGVGLHARLAPPLLSRCGGCHSEHRGAAFEMVNARSFALSGIDDPEWFDHREDAALSYLLKGRHAALACERCHKQARAGVLPPGEKRFLGLSQDCEACHEDKHKGTLGKDCASCHGQEKPFPAAARMDHDERFPLSEGHAWVACTRCHEKKEGGPALEVLLQADPERTPPPVRACAPCHENPHRLGPPGSLTALFLPDSGDCARCHDTTAFKGTPFGPDKHAAIGVDLLGEHEKADCVACHHVGRPKAEPMAGAMDACVDCHASPHAAEFLLGIAAEEGTKWEETCAGCHRSADPTFLWPVASMGERVHGLTGFPLETPHQDLACASCHEDLGARTTPRGSEIPSEGFLKSFPRRAAMDCTVCHGDPHKGQFREGPFAQTLCVGCHRTDSFAPARFTPELHAQSRFPLTGSHEAVLCNDCHKLPSGLLETKREDRELRPFRGLPLECAGCHRDVHNGVFDRPGVPTAMNGKGGCERCHATSTWSALELSGYDHGRLTGYALLGAHATTACAGCHPRGKEPDPNGRLFGNASKACESCHPDIHAGQFRKDGATDCAPCHTEKSWKELLFDHQRDSRFPLDEDHAKVPCEGCHKPVPVPRAEPVVRYKPLGVRCEDCHDTRRLSGFLDRKGAGAR